MKIETNYELISTFHGTYLAFDRENFTLKHSNNFSEKILPVLYCQSTNRLLIEDCQNFFTIKNFIKNFHINLTHHDCSSKIKIFYEEDALIISQNNKFLRARKNEENQFSFNEEYNTWEKFFLIQK